MLYLAVAYLLISCISLLAGIIFYERVLPGNKPFFYYIITGFILLTGLAQWLVLVIPLQPVVIGCLLLLVVLLAILQKQQVGARLTHLYTSYRQQPLFVQLCPALLLFMILVLNAGPSLMDDTQSYHIQMVKWIQEYGTVPGLANLHFRYGFNSSWFVSIGLLLPSFKGINTYQALNGLISCWVILYLFQKINSLLRSGSLQAAIGVLLVLIAGLAAWPLIRGNATSANYDFITTACLLVLFIETATAREFNSAPEWLIWTAYLFTVRVINGPLLLLAIPAVWLFVKHKQWKPAIVGCCIALLLVAPFLIRNVYLSGYLFYPATGIDLFSVDWNADKKAATEVVEYIKYFNRVSTYYQPVAETKSLSFSQWAPQWFSLLAWYNKVIVVASFLSYIICLLKWKYLQQKTNVFTMLLLAVLFVYLLCWFWLAPDPRFAYGPLLGSILLLCFLLPLARGKSLKGVQVIKGLCTIIAFAGFLYAAQKLVREQAYRNWLQPLSLPVPPVKEVKLDHVMLHIPEKLPANWNARCYAISLPCLYEVDPRLRSRGQRIEDGFKLDYNR